MQCRLRRLRVDRFAEHLIQYSALKMAERANMLRNGSRQNASDLPMTAGGRSPGIGEPGSLCLPSRFVISPKRRCFRSFSQHSPPPLKSSKFIAFSERRRRPAGSVPIGWRGLSPLRRLTREGACPHAPRFAPPCVWLFPLVSDRIKFSAAICFTSASRRRMFGVGVERKTV